MRPVHVTSCSCRAEGAQSKGAQKRRRACRSFSDSSTAARHACELRSSGRNCWPFIIGPHLQGLKLVRWVCKIGAGIFNDNSITDTFVVKAHLTGLALAGDRKPFPWYTLECFACKPCHRWRISFTTKASRIALNATSYISSAYNWMNLSAINRPREGRSRERRLGG